MSQHYGQHPDCDACDLMAAQAVNERREQEARKARIDFPHRVDASVPRKVQSAIDRVLEACYFTEKRHWEEHGKPMPDVAHMLYHDLEVLRCWRDGEPMPPDGRCTV